MTSATAVPKPLTLALLAGGAAITLGLVARAYSALFPIVDLTDGSYWLEEEDELL